MSQPTADKKALTLFSRLSEKAFLIRAWRVVRAHYGEDAPAGVAEFERKVDGHTDSLARQLRSGTYVPHVASLFQISKPNHPGETRTISLLELEDRIVLTGLTHLLSPIFERQFLEGCYAYRPGRSAMGAVEAVHENISEGFVHVATGDINDFFASVNRDLLLRKVRQFIWESPILSLLETYLNIGAVVGEEWKDTGRGLAQGSPLSPVLSNLYLTDFDGVLEAASGLRWARYADNILIQGRERQGVLQLWEKGTAYLRNRCDLEFNADSVAITDAQSGFEFLGFSLQGSSRTMAPVKVEQKRRELEATLRARQGNLKGLVEDISETVRGWIQYYGSVPETHVQLAALERHLEELLGPWLTIYRSQVGTGHHTSAELKAMLAGIELPTTRDGKQKMKWVEGLLSKSRPTPKEVVSLSAKRAIRKRKEEIAARKQFLEEILITKPGTYLGRTGERLLIRHDGKREAEVPFSLVKHITLLTSAVSMSGELMVEVSARGIPIVIAGFEGRPVVRVGTPELPSHEMSAAQSVLAASVGGLELAKTIVAGKVRNQANLLQYYLTYPERRSGGDFLGVTTAAIRNMLSIEREVRKRSFSADLDLERNRLFAAEGQAAASYWAAIRSMLWWKPGFEKRVHRGAFDLVNSLLNYGYGILYSRLWVILVRAGLNVNIGFLHKPQAGKAGLLYDFIEEFRAMAVDRTVFSMLNVGAEVKVSSQGLDSDTRHRLARAVVQRIQSGVRYHGDSVPLTKVMGQQSELLARHIQGRDRYRTFVLPW